MKAFEKILVPVDFAAHSAAAVELAIDLARRYEAQLTLVHVYEPIDYALPPGYVVYTPDQLSRMTAELDKRLQATGREVEGQSGRPVEVRLLQGPAALVIVDFARDESYDLIVMGTHGRTGVGHFLMGSVAEKVVRSAPCAVLTIKAPSSTPS